MVTARALRKPFDRHPVAREAMIAIAAVGAFGLWIDLIVEAVLRYVPIGAIDAPGGPHAELALDGFLTSLVVIVGMVLFVAAYLTLRDVAVTPARPERRPLGYAAGGIGSGVVLVAAVELVAVLIGGSLSAATGSIYSPGASAGIAALVTALGLLVGVPAYLLVTHVLVQRSVRRTARPMAAVGITTLIVGTIGPVGVLTVSPFRATVVVLVALAIALPVVAAGTYGRRWLTVLTALPLALLLAGLLAERATDVPGAVGAAYVVAEIGVVAVGAYAYERTDSTLPSALAYATFVVAAEAVVFATQAGVQF